ELDIELGPQHLPRMLEMLQNLARMGTRRREQEVTRGKARHGPVIEDDTILTQHDAVSGLPDGQARDRVRIHPVEESCSIDALHVDLSQRRDVADPDTVAHAENFSYQRALPVPLTRERECLCAPPLAQVHESRAPTLRPAMARRQP